MKKLWKAMTRFERILWLSSMAVVTASFLMSPDKSVLSLIDSLIGVTALIFVAKGYILGQVMTVAFAVLYGVISLRFHYYGEVITYLCMSAPAAVAATVMWIRHRYRGTAQVTVARQLRLWQFGLLALLTAAVAVGFYFILGALGTANLVVSTVSVATSFMASCLVFLRSPYYGLAYGCNDVVLIVLWLLAAMKDISYLPMLFCFVMFLANDLYGFFNWLRLRKTQAADAEQRRSLNQ